MLGNLQPQVKEKDGECNCAKFGVLLPDSSLRASMEIIVVVVVIVIIM